MQFSDGEFVVEQKLQRLANSVPASYTLFPDGTTFYGERNFPGGDDLTPGTARSVLQAALTALYGVGGKVYAKAGTYDLTAGNVAVYGDTVLEGDGDATIFQVVPGDYGISLTSSNIAVRNLKITRSSGIYTDLNVGWSNTLIDNVHFVNSNCGTAVSLALQAGHRKVTVRNCLIEGAANGMVITADVAPSGVLIERNTILDSYDSGITVYRANGLQIKDNTLFGFGHAAAGGSGITFTTASAQISQNNQIIGNKLWADAADASNQQVPIHITVADATAYNRRFIVSENTIYGLGASEPANGGAIVVEGAAGTQNLDFIISDNNIYQTRLGIHCIYCEDFLVAHNTIEEVREIGIFGGERDFEITDNIVRNCGMGSPALPKNASAIFLRGAASHHVVKGNKLYDDQLGAETMQYGIYEDVGTDYNTFKNNTIVGAQTMPYLLVGANGTYDAQVLSEEVQINGATTIPVMTFTKAAQLAKATLLYGTLVANDTNVEVGYGDVGGVDRDKYVASVTSGTGAIWETEPLTLTATPDIGALDTVTFYQDGSGGAGEYIRLLIEYLTL